MADAKVAVVQAILYSREKGTYPASMKALREAGYGKVPDTDPWGNEYVFAPTLLGAAPKADDHVYMYSKGPCGTAVYPLAGPEAGKRGPVGYSSLDGAFGH
jgi:hypothetical protein